MSVYVNEKERNNKKQDYIDYLKRAIRNKKDISIYEEHIKELSKQIALSYGLTLAEYTEIGNDLKESN